MKNSETFRNSVQTEKCNKTRFREVAQRRWPDAIILEGSYKPLTPGYLCFTKVPVKAPSFLKTGECQVVSINQTSAVYMLVKEHYKRCFLINGVRIHQNFFVPEEILGTKLLLKVKVTSKFARGKREFVVDYTLPGKEDLSNQQYVLKIGTPKKEGDKIIRISTKSYLTFSKYIPPNFPTC